MKNKIIGLLSIATIVLPTAISLSSCGNNNGSGDNMNQLKIASFNLSFAVDNDKDENYQRWIDWMSYSYETQNQMIQEWKDNIDPTTNKSKLEEPKKTNAERVIQIRNIAAIIQYNRPDAILLNEFNNDGNGDMQTMELFAKNYLAYGQSLNSVDGGDMLEPIKYNYMQSFATNTGLLPDDSTLDFDNLHKGQIPTYPDDAYGFGYYHGHYAFGVMSKYKIETSKTRTFQNFKWKDMEGATNPKVTKEDKTTYPNLSIGDNWFGDNEWNEFRLSSKNHVDLTINVNNTDVHLLMSHPTPPSFDTISIKNQERNYYEVKFWQDYINNKQNLYDDNNVYGGIDGTKEKFLILGDQNADPNNTTDNKSKEGIKELLNDPLINQKYNNEFLPVSDGAKSEKVSNNTSNQEARTSTFGLRTDYAIPSNTLEIIETGVYWAAPNQKGRLLFNDPRIGQRGADKEVSSDHRLVWTTVKI